MHFVLMLYASSSLLGGAQKHCANLVGTAGSEKGVSLVGMSKAKPAGDDDWIMVELQDGEQCASWLLEDIENPSDERGCYLVYDHENPKNLKTPTP